MLPRLEVATGGFTIVLNLNLKIEDEMTTACTPPAPQRANISIFPSLYVVQGRLARFACLWRALFIVLQCLPKCLGEPALWHNSPEDNGRKRANDNTVLASLFLQGKVNAMQLEAAIQVANGTLERLHLILRGETVRPHSVRIPIRPPTPTSDDLPSDSGCGRSEYLLRKLGSLSKGMKVLETAVGAIFVPTNGSLW